MKILRTDGRASRQQGGRQRLCRLAAQLRRLAGSVDHNIGHLAAGDGHGNAHLAQTALRAGGVGAVGVGVGIIGSRHGAGVGDIEGQHDAEDDVQHQHEDHVAGHVFFHGL